MYKLLLGLCLAFNSSAQFQLWSYKFTNSENQRALISIPNGLFLSGSSEAVLRLYGPKQTDVERYKLNDQFKEIRDLCITTTGYIAMQSDDTSCILLLDKNFKVDSVVYLFGRKAPLFLDGICAEGNYVFLLGDPIDGKFSTFRSFDNGLNWEPTPGQIAANNGEAAYAASGQTNQIVNGQFYFVSGGLTSRFFHSTNQGLTWTESALPYPSCPTCGPYAMAVRTEKEIMTVGGSYLEPNTAQNTCFYSNNGGLTWSAPKKGPSGYRSCVIYANKCYYACGTNGIDVSKDGGKTWKQISRENALSMACNQGKLYVTLANGSLLVLDIEK
ncbi:MAG: WD40/YVTN/BNR-like repeat-containing protein [Sphingomonadales bacterium]